MTEKNTRLYPILVEGVAEALATVFSSPTPADRVLERMFKSHPKWGARDRAFVAETTYDIIRNYRRLYEAVGKQPGNLFEYRQLIGWFLWQKGYSLPDWLVTAATRQLMDSYTGENQPFEISESYPDWLHAAGNAQLGGDWEAIAAALNLPAALVLRVNSLKTTREAVLAFLHAENIPAQALGAEGILVEKRANVFKMKPFQDGWFEVQDAASQEVARALAPKPGEWVIDACAGAGGKTLHLAALMQNKGRITALDVETAKLEELRRRARRAGAHTIEVRTIDSSKTIKRLAGQADRLLLDVPCSGLGVLRRNPDTKWRLTPALLSEVQALQADILNRYAFMLKPGGTMVYATCSILPAENEAQIEAFTKNHPDFQLIEQKNLHPHTFGYDGFFIATLSRKG